MARPGNFIFIIRRYKEILDRMQEPLVPKFRPDLFVRLKDIAKKTGLRKAETDSSCA